MTYHASLYGSSIRDSIDNAFETITAAREWAETYGNTADYCVITTASGKVVASHVRDTSGDGMTWRKASI